MKNIYKTTLILRRYSLEETLVIAQEANKYPGCFNLEITTNTDKWDEIIKTLIEKNYENILVGAGTVLNMDLLKKAIEAGAKFALSPIVMSKEMIDYCKEKDVVSVSGAFSPSEIYQVYQNGSDAIKVFPISDLSMNYIKNITGPFERLPIMAVGGVNVNNAQQYLDSGAKYVGIGAGICNRNELLVGNKASLIINLKKLSMLK